MLRDRIHAVENTTVDALWWHTVCQFIAGVKADEVVGPVVAALPEPTVPPPPSEPALSEPNTFWSLDSAHVPLDPDDWGRAAWLSLVHLQGARQKPQHPPVSGSALSTASLGKSPYRVAALEGYVRPAFRWLLREIDRGASLHGAVERWIRRIEWTGPRAGEELAKLDEDQFQRDLQRFLFDQGVEFAHQGREHHAARGRVDFLLRTGEPVAVELKVWRGDESLSELRGWVHQARRYPRDFGITTAYLVILAVSTAKRLVLRQGFGAGDQEHLVLGSVTIHVRLADLGRIFDSKDHTRRLVVLDSADLDPDGSR